MSLASMHSASALMIALADAAARSIVLGSVVAAALAAFRAKNVCAKLLAWKGLLLAALAMPALVLISPAVRVFVPLPSFADHSIAVSAKPVTEPDVDITVPGTRILPQESAPSAPQPRAYPSAEPSPPMPRLIEQAAPPPAPARREIPWTLIAFSIYAVVALALLVRILVGIAFGNRLVRAATPVDEPGALEHLSSAGRVAGLRCLPRLAESEMLSVPIMIGVRRPTILLPADGRVWEEDELAAVLLHEVSHVARRDALSQRLALIHRAIFWFSPLAWWLERHLADLSEQASDEAALAGGVDRTRYAEALLGFFADLEAVPARVWWQGVSMAKAGQAEKRVDRILAWRGAMANHISSRGKTLLVVAFAIVAVPVIALTAAVRLAAYDIQAPPAPAAPPAPEAAPVASADSAPAAQATPATPAPPAVAPAGADEGDADVQVMVLPPLPRVRVDIPPVNVDMPRVQVNVPPVNVNVPPIHVAVPQIHIETHMLPSQDGTPGDVIFSSNGAGNFGPSWRGAYFIGRYDDWGPRFAIVTKDSDALTMSGDRDDAEHARSLKKKYSGDFIWFQHEEKSYVIDDAAIVARAKQLWQPQVELQKQQKDLAKQQEDLAKQEEDAANKIQEMKIKVPDLSAEMQKLEDAMKKLSANGGTINELSDLQSEIGELQSRIGEVESSAGREQGAFGREQGEWGRKMGELGRQQGELGRKQAQESREAAGQMQQLLDDAVAKGLAKPE
jgi:beta-lactamase regulating signal transducer with metallopeptidase domain